MFVCFSYDQNLCVVILVLLFVPMHTLVQQPLRTQIVEKVGLTSFSYRSSLPSFWCVCVCFFFKKKGWVRDDPRCQEYGKEIDRATLFLLSSRLPQLAKELNQKSKEEGQLYLDLWVYSISFENPGHSYFYFFGLGSYFSPQHTTPIGQRKRRSNRYNRL